MLLWLLFVALSVGTLITPNISSTTFRFTQSSGGLQLWTTPNTRRIRSTHTTVPTSTGTTLRVRAARHGNKKQNNRLTFFASFLTVFCVELESFQIIVAPTTGVASMTVSHMIPPGLSSSAMWEVAVASYSPAAVRHGSWSIVDRTTPILSGGNVALSGTLPTVLWCTIYVPKDACGKRTYTSNITLTPQGGAPISIPVELYVFDFTLDDEPHFYTNGESQPRFQGSTYSQAQLDAMYEVYGAHRLSGRSQSWPAGLNHGVAWDHNLHVLKDMDNATSTQACIWANGCDYRRYVLGLSGTWRNAPYTRPKFTPTAGSEVTATEAGRPPTFGLIGCNTSLTTWNVALYNGWMCKFLLSFLACSLKPYFQAKPLMKMSGRIISSSW